MLRRLVLAAVVVAATLLAVPPLAAADAGVESEFVRLTNGERASGLRVDGELVAVARRWAEKMAREGRLAHNPNLADEVKQDWQKLGENVGTGDDAPQIHHAFMRSPAHKANIVDADFTHVGIGVAYGADGRIWVTEVFMRLSRGGGSPPTTAAPAAAAAPAPPPKPAPKPAPTAPKPVVTSPVAPTSTPAPAAPPPAPEATPPAQATASATAPAPPLRSAAAGVSPPRYALVLEGLARLDDGA